MTDPKTILVTGCAGFIGSNLVAYLKNRFPKTTIIGIDDFSTGKRDRCDQDIVFYEGSICDDDYLEAIFRVHKPEYVIHLAALPQVSYSVEHPAHTTHVNVFGTVNVLEKARDHGVKRFLFSSSAAVYGNTEVLPVAEHTHSPSPQTPYGLHKHAAETFCKIFSSLFDIDTVCFRFFNVFGPGQYGDSSYATVLSAWLENMYIKNEKKPFLEGDGSQSRDFCYVDNVIHALELAMLYPNRFGGDVFNISCGDRVDLIKIKKLIETYTDQPLDLENRPSRSGDISHSHADISKAKKILGYKPIVDFETGLKKTIEWFKSRV